MKLRRKRYTPEFKRMAVERFELCESPRSLAEELGVERAMLYRWQKQLRGGGELRPSGRPAGTTKAKPPAEPKDLQAAQRRIAELERVVGQQRLEIDFFRGALHRVEELRRARSAPGVTASTHKLRR